MSKISKILPNHKTKLKKIEIGRITILNGSTSIQYGQESITSHNLSNTIDTCVKCRGQGSKPGHHKQIAGYEKNFQDLFEYLEY